LKTKERIADMGKKRITAIVEVTYAPDDARSLDELRVVTSQALSDGAEMYQGHLAAYAVTSASVDPDAEPTADDVPSEPVDLA
jgi:hypothetical protein